MYFTLRHFNIWVDDISNNGAQSFLKFLNDFSLVDLTIKPINNSGDDLDLVITKKYHFIIKTVYL